MSEENPADRLDVGDRIALGLLAVLLPFVVLWNALPKFGLWEIRRALARRPGDDGL